MKLLINILLMIASILLAIVLFPLGVVVTLILLFFKDPREYFTNTSDYPFGIAYGIDMLGNVICGDLFNVTLIKKDGYQFGKLGDTISYAVGKNILTNKLTIAGLILNSFLNLFEKDHALKAVNKTDSK